MIRLAKLVGHMLINPTLRFRFMYSMIRNAPGDLGMELRRLLTRRWFGRVGESVRIHEGVRFRNIQNIFAGDHVEIGVDNFLQAGGGLEIGDDTMLGPGVKIWTQNHVFLRDDIPIREQGAEYKKVVIGRDVWIGANAFIMPGAELGDGVVVSAGAVVGCKKIPSRKIVAGNPARVIGERGTMPGDGGSAVSTPA
ncbi:MAG: acyltransferase [candidate division Zixibacteria bacterium]|nr:acyltransferase [candidate division Zixibacteria bacterium]